MEEIKHECGVALIRLLKPIEYYVEKYGTWKYGLNKLYLLMEKQHNRGQEGAGIGCVSAHAAPGTEYIFRERAMGTGAIQEVFENAHRAVENIPQGTPYKNIPFCGEAYIGHLRYSTTGRSGISYVHPFLRRNNWRSRSLMICGNFNMTNVDEIFEDLVSQGQHPRLYSDTLMILEKMGDTLDKEVEQLYEKYKPLMNERLKSSKVIKETVEEVKINNTQTNSGSENKSDFDGGKCESKKPSSNKNFGGNDINVLINRGQELNQKIAEKIDMANVLRRSSQLWDGGYVICGITGTTEMFAFRDPCGIRPAFYYYDDDIVVLASERPVIQTVMDVSAENVRELQPGQALLVKENGSVNFEQIQESRNIKPCSFERIYFSRGSDKDIYFERKMLGKLLVDPIMDMIYDDLNNTVFSFIPNTAEVAFYGMMEGFDDYLQEHDLKIRIRQEKVAIKDIKLRTFITEDSSRDDLAAHVYDITYGSVRPYIDNLVVIDDSIVRGTTLKQSIIKILDRLHPKKIVVVSSSPQIRYPDCYGIDMNKMDEFVAFRAAISLLKKKGKAKIIEDTYKKSKAQEFLPKEEIVNYVKEIYKQFTPREISDEIAWLLTPEGTQAEVRIVFQSLEGLHIACPNHIGDWYFSGDYPTPGGNKVVNNAFIRYYETNM